MYKIIICFFIIISLFSCTLKKSSRYSENNIELEITEKNKDVIIDESLLFEPADLAAWQTINQSGIILDKFNEIYQNFHNVIDRNQKRHINFGVFETTLDNRNKKRHVNYGSFETTLDLETPMYEIDGDETSFIKNLQPQTDIVILAQNNLSDNRFYLIKTKDDVNLWSGWIHNKFISNDLNSEIGNRRRQRRGKKLILLTTRTGISTRNDVFAAHTGYKGEFIILKNNGELCIIKQDEIIKTNPEAVDGGIIGWSIDKTKIWFSCYLDAFTTNYGIIDINRNMYTILDRPPSMGISPVRIDFENGIIYYSDYYRSFEPEIAKQTKEKGETYHLYSYNFFTKELNVIDTNIGEGFIINFNQSQGMTYEKSNIY